MTVDSVKDCVEFMQIYGYTHGMIAYWYANVMVEMSDSTLFMAPMWRALPTGAEPIMSDRKPFLPENRPDKLVIFLSDEELDLFREAYPESIEVFEGVAFTGMEVETDWIFTDD